MISYMIYDIIHDIVYDRTYHIIDQCSIRSAAALRRPRGGSGLAATRLCRLVAAPTALNLLSLSR